MYFNGHCRTTTDKYQGRGRYLFWQVNTFLFSFFNPRFFSLFLPSSFIPFLQFCSIIFYQLSLEIPPSFEFLVKLGGGGNSQNIYPSMNELTAKRLWRLKRLLGNFNHVNSLIYAAKLSRSSFLKHLFAWFLSPISVLVGCTTYVWHPIFIV